MPSVDPKYVFAAAVMGKALAHAVLLLSDDKVKENDPTADGEDPCTNKEYFTPATVLN
jgi:hypothetical protein